MEGNIKEVHFLDTIVFKDEHNYLSVRPYVKPTDKNNYLHFKSFHKRHLKVNIPYGQFLRLKRNSTKNGDYLAHAQHLKGLFSDRGYPKDVITDAASKALQRPRQSLFTQKENKKGSRLVWALDYTPKAAAITAIIRKHWHLPADIPGCQEPPLIGLRKTKTLRNLLVKSDATVQTSSTSTLPVGHYACVKCKFCSLMMCTRRIVL